MNPEYTTELRRVAIELIEAGDPVTAGKLIVLASKMDGTYKQPRTIATTRARWRTCDVCGCQLYSGGWDGKRCVVVQRGEVCTGTYRLDPEPVLQRGEPMDITVAELAAGMAKRDFERGMRDFLADDPDNDDEDTADWPDIASTYRGRRA